MKFETLKNKIILIISPNFWGDIHLTKHSYALEISKLGANVYFLNPPSRNFKGYLKSKKINKNLTIINYKLHIPGRLKFFFPKFYYIYMKYVIKRIEKFIEKEIYVTLDFSTDLIFSIKGKENYFKAKYNIFFPVDNVSKDYKIFSKNIADYYFSISENILSPIDKNGIKSFNLGHCLSGELCDKNILTNISKKNYDDKRNKVVVGYVGNLFMNNINFDALIKLINSRSDISFHFIGPHNMDMACNNLGVQIDNTHIIEKIKKLKNTVFHGFKVKSEVIKISKNFDAMIVSYYQVSRNVNAPVNSHKILEYLALGKIVISNHFDDYNNINNKYIFMPEKNHNTDDYLNKFNQIIKDLSFHNELKFQKKRISFAQKNTYKLNTKIIFKSIKF